MFTGIITNRGVLREKKKQKGQVRLMFQIVGRTFPLRLGESIAVDGVCLTAEDAPGWPGVSGAVPAPRAGGRAKRGPLTATKFRKKIFYADLIPETLSSTTLGNLKTGQRVNLERSLRVGDSLGGHWVTGHVDGVGSIRKWEREGESFRLQIGASDAIIRSLIAKGSIAVDGISFTVQAIRTDSLIVGVTPHTYRQTTLQWKRPGDPVNLEVDFFAKLVQRFLKGNQTTSLRVRDLKRQGF